MQAIELDVSHLSAPEPFHHIVSTLNEMGKTHYLRVHHRRQPKMLYQTLLDMGFEFHVQTGEQQPFEIIIWHGCNQKPTTLSEPDLARVEFH